jgi:hypothetical protein
LTHPLYDLLKRLDEANFYYSLNRHRDDTVLVTIAFVGERVEIDVFNDGHMEVSRFLGTEDVLGGEELVNDLIEKHSFENKIWEKYSRKGTNKKPKT